MPHETLRSTQAGSALGQPALWRRLSAAEHASGCPEPRPASANPAAWAAPAGRHRPSLRRGGVRARRHDARVLLALAVAGPAAAGVILVVALGLADACPWWDWGEGGCGGEDEGESGGEGEGGGGGEGEGGGGGEGKGGGEGGAEGVARAQGWAAAPQLVGQFLSM